MAYSPKQDEGTRKGIPKNQNLEEECESKETDIYLRGYNAGKKDGKALVRGKTILDKLTFGIYDAENSVSEHLKINGVDHYSRDYLIIHAKLMECMKLLEEIREEKK